MYYDKNISENKHTERSSNSVALTRALTRARTFSPVFWIEPRGIFEKTIIFGMVGISIDALSNIEACKWGLFYIFILQR